MTPAWRQWLLTDYPASRRQARAGQAYRTWLSFRLNKLAMLGLIIVLALILMAVFADFIATHSPVVGGNLRTERLLPPSAQFWFGTDEQARDIFSRIVYGSRLTLMVVALVAVIATPVGLLVGTTAGYFGGWIDTILMRITDIFLAFPRLILALAFVAALGPGIENAIIAISITSWPPYARLARAETLTIRDSDFIAATKLQGASSARIIWGHVVPLCLSSVIVRVTLDMAGITLTAAGLGFLGRRCGDIYFCMRVYRTGPVAYMPESLTEVRRHGQNLTDDLFEMPRAKLEALLNLEREPLGAAERRALRRRIGREWAVVGRFAACQRDVLGALAACAAASRYGRLASAGKNLALLPLDLTRRTPPWPA